jgi:phosphatidate phosphatase APP1
VKRWVSAVTRLAAAVEGGVDRAVAAARDRLGYAQPPRIVPYRGYGTSTSVLVLGRVLRNAPLPPTPQDADSWANLLATFRRFETDEVPGARVRISLGDSVRDTSADAEGYFECELPITGPRDNVGLWLGAQAELLAPRAPDTPLVVAPVLVPPSGARLGVVSDIDDTVIRTDVTQFVRMARSVLLGNARTRLPFPGVAAFYRALHAAGEGRPANPLFYVSSSPWNLYELLVELFELHQIPLGPLVLRDWGLTSDEFVPSGHTGHKVAAIRRIFATYPELPFILVGDSGQEDPEIYAQLIREFPGRVLAAYIRDVGHAGRRAAVQALSAEMAQEQAPLLLTEDTLAVARHAAQRGWIAESALADIADELHQAPP